MNTVLTRLIKSRTGDLSLSGVVLVLAGWALWSMDPIMVYLVGPDVPRMLMVSVGSLASGVSLIFFAFRVLRRTRRLPKRHVWLIVIQAVFFSALASLAYMSAVKYLNPGIVSVILRTQIAFAVLWAVLFLGERMNRISVAGIILIFLANTIILVIALRNSGGGSLWGWLLAFIASVLWSGGTVSSKELLKSLTPMELTGIRMLLAGIFMTMVFFISGGASSLSSVSARQWIFMVIEGIVTSGFGFILYFYGLRKVPVYIATGLEPIAPLYTLIVAYFYLQKTITLGDMVGIAVLLLGTAVVVGGNMVKGKKVNPVLQPNSPTVD